MTQQPHLPAKLLAIIEVSPSEKVRCGRPGCKHTVYKAVHVVRDAGQLMVLGSTCFAKRYGGAKALGPAQHWGAAGKVLTQEERALLDSNTEALLQGFAVQEEQIRQEAAAKLKALQERLHRPPPAHSGSPMSDPRRPGDHRPGHGPVGAPLRHSSCVTAPAGSVCSTATADNASRPGQASKAGMRPYRPVWASQTRSWGPMWRRVWLQQWRTCAPTWRRKRSQAFGPRQRPSCPRPGRHRARKPPFADAKNACSHFYVVVT